jgi:16S rRNA (guanine527-N7)-methyltransferase
MTPDLLARLLAPYTTAAPDDTDWTRIYAQLHTYLALLLKWNAKTNLTAIRTPEEIVRRHFGESLFAGIHLGPCARLLDLGSGAGFPGIPIQLLRPDLAVTLAESQGKKAAFLREVVRELGLKTEVWAARAESMPASRRFEAVTLRAVDDMASAIAEASRRCSRTLVILTSKSATLPDLSADFDPPTQIPLPMSTETIFHTLTRR